MTNTKKGILLLLLAAFLYSIMTVLIRLLGAHGVPAASQVFFRYIFAFLAAGIYFFVAKTKVTIQKKDILLLLSATIFGYALTNLFFTYGILYTQVSTALFLYYTYAIIAPILGFLFLKDKVNVFNIIALILSFIALLFLFQPNTVVGTWKLGGFFGVLSALSTASYLILRKKLHQYPASFMMFINTLAGVAVVGVISLSLETSFYTQGGIQHLPPNIWLATILFGIDNFFAWFAMTKGFEYFQATTSSIILLSELIFGIIFAFFFFGEIPTYATVIGGGLIIISSALVIFKGKN